MSDRKDELFIYEQISKEKDFIPGFGPKELSVILIAALIGFITGSAIKAATGQFIYGFFTAAGIVAVTGAVVRRDIGGENFIDKIRLFVFTIKMQKIYLYYYEDKETENERTEDNGE